MKRIVLLGSTGSIGTQALDVVARYPDEYQIIALAARGASEAFYEQVRTFSPQYACLVNKPESIPADLLPINWGFGQAAVDELAALGDADAVIVSVVGMAGLRPALLAAERGKDLLLATKEALVVGGDLIKDAARRSGARILPLDSEHSAIFQCLEGAGGNKPRKIILTASGGPFRTASKAYIDKATAQEALCHPTWNMGSKITIDSATMMNKGLEVIEAVHLFGLPLEQIEVLIHPQSIIHSMVEYEDASVIAQLGTPDMRVAIAYALSYPARKESGAARLDLAKVGTMTFEAPDFERFACLALAFEAMRIGGSMPCVLNAANEVAVGALLAQRIPVGGIERAVRGVMEQAERINRPNFEELVQVDAWARRAAEALV